MITAMRHEYPIDELCTAFAVSRSGYYAHLRKPSGRRRCEDEALRPRVAAAFKDSRLTYGTPRLREVPVREGTAISQERIGRIMREMEQAEDVGPPPPPRRPASARASGFTAAVHLR